MQAFLERVESINHLVNGFVWGTPTLCLFMLVGVLMTIITKGFQFSHLGHWMKSTIGSVWQKDVSGKVEAKGEISQFQALCTALAATAGVGNIAGVATAIASGGPGAVFWMWMAAVVGGMTNYAEKTLGIFYRRKNAEGEWTSGPMYYLVDGLGSQKGCYILGKVLAVLFSIFTLLASFGIGNASQINTIATNMKMAFSIPHWVSGGMLMILAGLVIMGGLKRLAAVTEKMLPIMAIGYILGVVIIVASHAERIIPAFQAIFSFAFGLKAMGGAALGVAIKNAVTWGAKRGIFSNEAGLGSSVMLHSTSNAREPARQGMWGIFEVFADTIVICTCTAMVILTSGLIDLETGVMLIEAEQTVLVAKVFFTALGRIGSGFVAIAILLFAFSSILGWSYYGTKAWEYLFGTRSVIIYKVIFVPFILLGATMSLDLAWSISDTFNGLMAMPNLIGLLALSPVVVKITRNYVARTFQNSADAPILSYDPAIQQEQAQALEEDHNHCINVRCK